jgi:hypothetical protein
MAEEDEDAEDESAPQPAQPTWQELRWKEVRGWLTWGFVGLLVYSGFWDDVKGWFWPDHPAPVGIEADGKNYLACNTPDIGRGLFQNTYHADFKDNNGSMISLRGVNKLIITNLPKMVDAPMPVFRLMPYPLPDVNGTDNAGKPYQEGSIYTWPDGSAAMFRNHQWIDASPGLPDITPGMEGRIFTYKEDPYRVRTAGQAQVKNGKWVPVKVKNTVCNSDDGSSN